MGPGSMLRVLGSHFPSISRRDVTKNAVVVVGAMALGDVTCQGIEGSSARKMLELGAEDGKEKTAESELAFFKWDTVRTVHMGLIAAFVSLPMSFAWHMTAEHFFPGRSVRSLAGKLVVQILAMPPMMIAQFAAADLMDSRSWQETVEHLERELPATVKAGYAFWPAIGVANNIFVDVKHRPAIGSVAGYFWNVFMSQRMNARPPRQLSAQDSLEPLTAPTEAVEGANQGRKRGRIKRHSTVMSI